ncbi:MAG: PAS domain-containing protein [Candidatus Doudnabacteria bacterium]|nr:PAS domain-containing protein [Candidatus Doudnabacteria bacterium]
MIINILLVADFIVLAIVMAWYIFRTLRERAYLRTRLSQSMQLQQKVYQAQVLKEISERIGYSLDTTKVVEIITNSLGNLLPYDTVSYMLITDNSAVFKCHVENSVSHEFIEEVKDKILMAFSGILNLDVKPSRFDESVTGNLLDDNVRVGVKSYFNLPVFIGEKLVGVINVASGQFGRFGENEASILYTITNQAALAVTRLQGVLRSERGKLKAVIDSITDGIISVDLSHQLLVANPSVREILEIAPAKSSEVSDITMFDIVDALAGKTDLRTKIDQALAEDKRIFVPDVVLKNRALEINITPVKNEIGEKVGANVVFHDITTEKSLEKLRQEFTAMMVHELRAPLTAVRWSSESMLKNLAQATGSEPGKVKDTLVTIETASNNMLELVNDLLDVAKIEAGKFELNSQEYDLAEVAKQQVEVFKPQAEVKHLALSLSSPEKLKAKFDRIRVSQVLGNLISNAIKYSDSGEIVVSLLVDEANKRVVVGVKDTGIGISREDLPVLFSKFKQLKSGDRSKKGTGLGLVVSKGIIESHGGQIWVESPGENLGSTFYFSLPN